MTVESPMPTALSSSLPPLGLGFSGTFAKFEAAASQTDRQREFAAILARRVERPGEAKASPEEQATDAARQLVSITFIQPMLAQLRETSQAAPPFAPTSAERQFRAMSDAQLAQDIVKAARFPLVDVLARQMLAKLERSAESAAPDKEVRP
jgi:Rod binding domain-containing protein